MCISTATATNTETNYNANEGVIPSATDVESGRKASIADAETATSTSSAEAPESPSSSSLSIPNDMDEEEEEEKRKRQQQYEQEKHKLQHQPMYRRFSLTKNSFRSSAASGANRSKRTKIGSIASLKAKVRSLLKKNLGSTEEKAVIDSINDLTQLNPTKINDDNNDDNGDAVHHISNHPLFSGEWTASTSPNFPGRIKPQKGEEHIVQYTLGRLSFNIFQPSKLVCTLRSVRNQVIPLNNNNHDSCSTTKHSKKNVDNKQTYLVLCDITIHTEQGDLPAILRNEGICYPNPKNPNRLIVSFSGGTLMPAVELKDNAEKLKLWQETFKGAYEQAEKERTIFSRMFLSIITWVLGLTLPTDSSLSKHAFHFDMKRSPAGYVDILYLDSDMRITKGNKGTLVVCDRTGDGEEIFLKNKKQTAKQEQQQKDQASKGEP